MEPLSRLRILFVLFLGILVGVGLTLERISQADQGGSKEPIPYQQLQRFSAAYTQIRDKYVEEVSADKLIDGAINGMVQKLDPHSSYLSKDMLREMRVETKGKFGGLGIEVTMENGFIKVVSPIDGTPADKAGLEAADLIVRIEDTPTKDLTLMEAVKKMRGEPGTKIKLTVIREGFDKPRDFTITRDIIQIESIKSRMLTEKIGYIRIVQFQESTASKLRQAVNQLRGDRQAPLAGLVLDLRNNPGGVLSAAVETADAFLRKGKIVYTKGRVESSDMTMHADSASVLEGAPMVTLVNAGSASASEIVAGALQDHGRAIIMGLPTFGKGSVQSIIEMEDGGGLKLTTARYFTPKGGSIQAKGVHPDIEVKPLEVKQPEKDGAALTEGDLPGHLKTRQPTQEEKTQEGEKGQGQPPSYLEDYQLTQAVNLLRGILLREGQRAS